MFTNLTKHSFTLDLNFWQCFGIHSLPLSLSLVFLWPMERKACTTEEDAACRNLVTIKKTKYLSKDQTYKSVKNIMSYSILLQVINKNAIIFYQKNMPKHPPSPMNWSSFMAKSPILKFLICHVQFEHGVNMSTCSLSHLYQYILAMFCTFFHFWW